jgi:hypothetical protein
MNEVEYIVYTTTSQWRIYAFNDLDAARKGLWFSWRDGEKFVKIERNAGGKRYTLRICSIDSNNTITTL